MLMAILNVEQARSSNVKRDQPNSKFASNIFRLFVIDIFVKFAILSNRGGHV